MRTASGLDYWRKYISKQITNEEDKRTITVNEKLSEKNKGDAKGNAKGNAKE